MAYIRKKGNQLALVHGARVPVSGKVEQIVLFSFYSEEEVEAALGDGRAIFRNLLEDEHPNICFDWEKIDAGLREHLGHLPAVYPLPADSRVRFLEALDAFAKEVLTCDPQSFVQHAQTIRSHRHELAYLHKKIDFLLHVCERDQGSDHDPVTFTWREARRRADPPPKVYEELPTLLARGELDALEHLAEMLVRLWPKFADGHLYLGLAAAQQGDLDLALEDIEEAVRLGRTLFPASTPREDFRGLWETRPYIRALQHQCEVLIRLGELERGLEVCEELDERCGQEGEASVLRAYIYLAMGRLDDAIAHGRRVRELWSWMAFVEGFALVEQGRLRDALPALLHAALCWPWTARELLGVPQPDAPRSFDEARDHDLAIDVCQLLEPTFDRVDVGVLNILDQIVAAPLFGTLSDELEAMRAANHPTAHGDSLAQSPIQSAGEAGSRAEHGADTSPVRSPFERIREMCSWDFACEQAKHFEHPLETHMETHPMMNTEPLKEHAFAALEAADVATALSCANALEEAGETHTAERIEASALFLARRWSECAGTAERIVHYDTSFHLVLAAARMLEGKTREASEHGVLAALNHPEELRELLGVDFPHASVRAHRDSLRCLSGTIMPRLERDGVGAALARQLSHPLVKEAVRAVWLQEMEADFKLSHNDPYAKDLFQDLLGMRSLTAVRRLLEQVGSGDQADQADQANQIDPTYFVYAMPIPAREVELGPAEADRGPTPHNAHGVLAVVPLSFVWGALRSLSHASRAPVDLALPEDVEHLPANLSVVGFKGRGTDAQRWSKLLCRTKRVALAELASGAIQVTVPIIGEAPRVLTVPPDAAHLLAPAQEHGQLILMTTGGGVKHGRRYLRHGETAWLHVADVVTEADLGPRAPLPVTTHYELEVSLDDVQPRVWRRILLRADASFQHLHAAVQAACGWNDSHLFSFKRSDDRRTPICTIDFEPADDERPAQKVRLRDYFESHDRCSYLYDFGDSWRHTLSVVARHDMPTGPKRRLLGGERAFPPEDAGGILGYLECCEVAYGVRPGEDDLEEHALRRAWLPRGWHPDRCDLESIAKRFDT